MKKSKNAKVVLGFMKIMLAALKKMAYNGEQHESWLIST
jgi:hypothetical protein